MLYKLGDAFAGSLSTAFLIRGAGFTATEVGAFNKVLGLIATIVGALAGGALLAKLSLWRALMWFGVLQAVSNFGYWLLAVMPKDYTLMAAAIGVENLCGGLGTAAFVAFLMALTDKRFTAAQYALLSALAAVGRVLRRARRRRDGRGVRLADVLPRHGGRGLAGAGGAVGAQARGRRAGRAGAGNGDRRRLTPSTAALAASTPEAASSAGGYPPDRSCSAP